MATRSHLGSAFLAGDGGRSARRSALIEELSRARTEYMALLSEDEVQIKAVRKCATRIYDLELQ